MLTEEFCRDSAILSSKRKRFETVTEGLGGKKLMDITVIKDFKIGNYKFKKVPVYVFDDEYNLTSYPYLAGLIGNDLLRRFNITLNYASRQIHLMPNSHFHEPFDYSYCGLGLFATGSDIVVSDVIPNSPAERAGLQVGDVIVAMNNNLSATMSNFRALLQQSGSKVKIIYRRDGKLAETKLSIVSII
jgi:membrane-associated protease RseP (regulator of RpoE activity)